MDIRLIGRLRAVIQAAFLLFTLFVGYRFFLFYQWALGLRPEAVARPGAVEGFLPISALLGVKQLLVTGRYDLVHPAGLTILLAAMLIALVCRKGFCGWICPVGGFSNLATGHRFTLRLPVWLDIPLLGCKYLLLFFFVWAIMFKMDAAATASFIGSPYNIAADAKMLQFFLHPSQLSLIVLAVLVGLSLVVRNFWCRYLCPYGALLGLFALASPLQIRRDPELCIDCKKCEKRCPALIRVTARQTVRNAECVGCLECVSVCPKKDCLTVRAAGSRRVPPLLLPLLALLLFFLAWSAARLSGHWQSQVPNDVFAKVYRMSGELGHPPVEGMSGR
ncbi:MAG: 4Fe-4S binding protein [Thermodesulfobacteriota bacterium]